MRIPKIGWNELRRLAGEAAGLYQEQGAFRGLIDGFLVLLGLLTLRAILTERAPLDLLFLAPVWVAARHGGSTAAYVIAAFACGSLLPGHGAGPAAVLLLCFAGMSRLIVSLESRLQALEMLARRDSLTGLPNRAALQEWGEACIRRAQGANGSLVLAMIDCNRFKSLNDQYGHAFGDQILRLLARHLRRAGRSCYAARLGGDEFVLMMPGRSLSDAHALLWRLNTAFSRSAADLGVEASISFGLSVLGWHGDSLPELLKAADRLMYLSKGREPISAEVTEAFVLMA